MTLNEKVLQLDLNHLTDEQIEWLHTLKNLAQRIRNAEFYKSQGITKKGFPS